MWRKPINADAEGNARCIKAGYYKMGWTNFTRNLGGGKGRLLRNGSNGRV